MVLSTPMDEFKAIESEGLTASVKEGKVEGKPILNYIYYSHKKAMEEEKSRDKKIKKARQEIEKLQKRVDKGSFKKGSTIQKMYSATIGVTGKVALSGS